MVINDGEGEGATKREGGGRRQVRFYSYQRGGGGGSFSHAEAGAQTVLA